MSSLESAFEKVKGAVSRAKSAADEATEKVQPVADTEGGRWVMIKAGDWLMEQAEKVGLPGWEKVWDDPKNKELRKRRIHPNILQEGDWVFVPNIVTKTDSGETEKLHRFVKPVPKAKIRVCLEDQDKTPISGASYVLKIKDEIIQGVTDGKGILEHDIPFNVHDCELRFDGKEADTMKFFQPGLIAPQLSSDYNTLRAFYKTPLDPEFTAELRLKAKKLAAGLGGVLQGELDGALEKGASLLDYCKENADAILSQVAQAQAGAQGLLEQAKGEVDKVGKMAGALQAQAKSMGEQAAAAASGAMDNVTDRAAEMAAGLEQKVDAAVGRLMAAEQQARQEVDRRVDQAQSAVQGVEKKVQESISEAQKRGKEAIESGVQQAQEAVEEAADTARQHISDLIDRNVDRSANFLRQKLAEARNRLAAASGAMVQAGREAYGQARDQVGEAADQAQMSARELLAEFSRLGNQGVRELGDDARALAYKMGIPVDGVVDSLMMEGQRFVNEAEAKANELISQGRAQAESAAQEVEQEVADQAEHAWQEANTAIDREVERAYAEIDGVAAKAKDLSKEAADRVDEAAAQAQGAIAEAGAAAQEKADEAAAAASDMASDASKMIQDKVGEVGEQAQAQVDAVKQAVDDGVAKVKQMRAEVEAQAGAAIRQGKAAIGDAEKQANELAKQGEEKMDAAMAQVGQAQEQIQGALDGGLAQAGQTVQTVFGETEELKEKIPNLDDMLEEIPISIGWLAPANEIDGVIGRLNNLGFDAGPPTAFMGRFSREAIRRFQNAEDLPINGQIDGAMLGRLIERHGC